MKKSTKISISIFAIAIGSIFISEYSSPAVGNAMGPTQACAGDPKGGGLTCAKSGCHVGIPETPIAGIITSNIPGAGYTPGSTYTFDVSFDRAGHTQVGFQISPQTVAGVFQGTLTATDVNTKLPFVFVAGGNATGKYIGHKNNLAKTWSFDWTAPVAGTGDVTFYGAFNASNASGSESGDSIFTSTLIVSEAIVVSSVASATITASPAGSIVSGTSVTFSVSPTNEGPNPTYQWQVGGSTVGTGTSYTTTTLTNGQVVTCILTSDLPGVTGSPATSNAITMVVTAPVGISELKDLSNRISIYPNPISDKLFVNTGSSEIGAMTITIMDANGKLVKKIKALANQPIDISDLGKGIYVLYIETIKGVVIKKVVKK